MAAIQGEIRDVYGEERRGEERRDETERCGFKKEMRDGGGEESGRREKHKREKRERMRPTAMKGRVCKREYSMGQMKWFYCMTSGLEITLTVWQAKKRELSVCDSPGERTLCLKETHERYFRGEEIMRGKIAQFTRSLETEDIYYLCHKRREKTESEMQWRR